MRFAMTMCLILAGLLVATTGFAGHHEADEAGDKAVEETAPVAAAPPAATVATPAAPTPDADDEGKAEVAEGAKEQ